MSGGQKHLLALAGVTALSPDILILDEPIAQLDPVHAKRIYEVLRELNVKYHKTIIVIEHHTEYIAKYCKNAVLIRNGGVVWKLPAKEALRRVGELQESNIFPPQVTIAADKMVKMGILPYDTILPVNIDEGKRVFEPYILNKEYRSQPCSLENNNNQMVVFQNVEVQYRAVKGDPVKILDNFNLEIKRGQKIALVGSNGAGKSTLLKLMMGLLKPSDGKVLIDNMNTKEMTPEKLSRIISLVYQNPEEMFIKDSIRGDIAYAMKARKVEDYEKRTQELLETFHLAELSERDGRLLSGGQMRRASLAIGIALNPGILLLDEPTANLDIATRKEIMKTLQVLKDVTDTVVIATHDMQLVCEWAERIIVLNAGCIIADGKREEIFSDNDVRELVGIRPPEIFEMGTSLGLSNKYFTIDDFLGCFERRAL
jgi:energy-coupling factor transport system ATP-binding protein